MNYKGYHHLKWEDRLKIEGALKTGGKPAEIAEMLGVCVKTIYNEIKRGLCLQQKEGYIFQEEYCAEVAERKMTVLVSSHNLRELEDTCDHVGIMHHGKIMIERSLSDLQGNISKIQVACQNGVPKLPDDFEVLHMANTGRVYTLIVKGDPKEAEKVLLTENPTIVDVLPLTLEEIFIYELGGVDYEVKDILL